MEHYPLGAKENYHRVAGLPLAALFVYLKIFSLPIDNCIYRWYNVGVNKKQATYTKYTVVLNFYGDNGIQYEDWNKLIDSPTRAGASRKAGTYLKDTSFAIVEKVRLDNYEYWRCEDN